VVLITQTVHFSRVYLSNAATAPLTPGCLSSVYYISSANYLLCCCATFVTHRITHSVWIPIFLCYKRKASLNAFWKLLTVLFCYFLDFWLFPRRKDC